MNMANKICWKLLVLTVKTGLKVKRHHRLWESNELDRYSAHYKLLHCLDLGYEAEKHVAVCYFNV